MKLKALAIAAAFGAMGLAGGAADAATYVVPGTSNPFLAGASGGDNVVMNGYTDTAAANSPVGVSVIGGQTLAISATGAVSNCPGCLLSGPNGAGGVASAGVTANGFTEIVNGYSNLPLNGLIGVFNNLGMNNPFLIGTGGTFVVPTGATTLYLATVDGYQWSNNIGSFSVNVGAVPEPATWALMILGFGAVGAGMRRKAARQTTMRYVKA
ncbi:PEPxxWA-CTERM sorting domain-containing protein [uncultured Sphingomonas sp.]|uniref:PEPxxWA-CTERM sorting domain-containing protein n=1 Tax=uncultured Sphingomonas sp. TaxID=158754 RepID=UPI00262197A0|nr:PEPxxWA-CTERM sorting domain-containing protein [uncultured Sphingomonas sp.]